MKTKKSYNIKRYKLTQKGQAYFWNVFLLSDRPWITPSVLKQIERTGELSQKTFNLISRETFKESIHYVETKKEN